MNTRATTPSRLTPVAHNIGGDLRRWSVTVPTPVIPPLMRLLVMLLLQLLLHRCLLVRMVLLDKASVVLSI
jgi:hypothetical protein